MELILASTSPYRRALLERLGVPFRCVAPPVDEEALKGVLRGMTPRGLAERLAEAKASSVVTLEPEAVVIGCDQVVSLDGSILGKPGTADQAMAQLRSMAGRSHGLITAIRIIHPRQSYAHTDVTKLQMRKLTPLEISRYVETDRPLDCAGSYTGSI